MFTVKKGKGSTFNIYLPAFETEAMEEELETVPNKIQFGEGTLLLVDDEKMILDVSEQMLQSLGYSVLIAGNGKEAIELYENNKDAIDMVILDMIMPGMGGKETFNILKKINPKVKVLLSSGYSINGQAEEIMGQGCSGFIQKPFNIETLSKKLREILTND
jgi:two-component system cell cycle sensor histidine kinase/response regulator CckA